MYLTFCVPTQIYGNSKRQSKKLIHNKAVVRWRASAKPLRVGIAGAGVAGLSAAVALSCTPNTGVQHIEIFEPREQADDQQGATLNINNAAAILASAYDIPVWDIGVPIDTITAREVSGTVLYSVDVNRLVTTSREAKSQLYVNGKHTFMTVMRDELNQLLIDKLGPNVRIRRGPNNRVTGVRNNGRTSCFVLQDGSISAPFDLVIGADGIRSKVRDYVVGKQTFPTYSGIRVQWAVAPTSRLLRGHMEQWFGDGAYVLHCAAGSERNRHEIIACSYRDTKQAAENAEYKQSKNLRDEFRSRLVRSGMPSTITDVLDRGERLIETGVHRHSFLSSWHRGPCCLVGDSAHAMPPYLGQGANQAVQDARCLSLAISRIGGDISSLSGALEMYERTRRVPVQATLQTSSLVGFLETQGGAIGARMRNNLFRVLGAARIQEKVLLQAAIPRIS